jgi:hypothetical protein
MNGATEAFRRPVFLLWNPFPDVRNLKNAVIQSERSEGPVFC